MEGKLFDDAFINKLDSISLRFNGAINNLYNGGRRSKLHGSSVEFANFREYTQGDDFRRIDWNAYGRFEKFFIKLFLDEKQLCTNVFIDTSKSMDFGEPTKLNLALKIGAAFAYISASATDKVTINGLAEGRAYEICPPMTGKASFFKSAEKLEKVSASGESRLYEALRGCRSLTNESGLSIIITDLMSGDDFGEILKYLIFKKQQVVLVHVLSPEEITPSFDGRVRLLDSETDTFCELDANTKTLECYEKALKDYINTIKAFCMKTGVYYLEAVSDEEPEDVILEKGTESGIIG